MDFKSLQRKAREIIEKRGGNKSLKEDAQQLKDIATGPGTMQDKAKRAADALKEPGATEGERDTPPVHSPSTGTTGSEPPPVPPTGT